jgi:hypothetical protein
MRSLLRFFLAAGMAVATVQAESILKLGTGVGKPGSTDNIITVSLENSEPVSDIQIQITDMPNLLKPDSVWLSPRCSEFSVGHNDLNGNLIILLTHTYAGQYIQPDTGAVLYISYSVAAAVDTNKRVELLFSKSPKLVGVNYTSLAVQTLNNLFLLDGVSAVEKRTITPAAFTLEQNYPNPFNPSTTIAFHVDRADWVNLSVYNSLGQRVATLLNRQCSPGVYQANWNGLNEQGQPVAGGLYLYRLSQGLHSTTKQMIYMK